MSKHTSDFSKLITEAFKPRAYVHWTRPRCPACTSRELKAYRSVERSTGSRFIHTLCKTCGEKFYLVIE